MPDNDPEIFKTLAGLPRTKVTPAKSSDKRDIFTPDARNVLEVLGFIALIVIGTERAVAWLKPSPPPTSSVAASSFVPQSRDDGQDERIHHLETKIEALTSDISEIKTNVAVIKDRLPLRK